MASIRKPFQGVGNIIRFNWHFYLAASIILLALLLAKWYILLWMLLATVFLSLFVSFYIYDMSGLYQIKWADALVNGPEGIIVNIHAGFDETSILLRKRYPMCALKIFDFYDPRRHTEISIKRARLAYPTYPGTQTIVSPYIPLEDLQADKIFLILSAHEIREDAERKSFFTELRRVLKSDGTVFVTEHLRDLPNFLAYNIGYFHFLSRSSWYKTFADAGFDIIREEKATPFVTTFILKKHGI